MHIREMAAIAVLTFSALTAPAAADRLRTYEASLARVTNVALGCVELQGATACRGDIQDVREILLTRMPRPQAEAYIRDRIMRAAAVSQAKPCILPALQAEPIQLEVNRRISQVRLRRDLIGKEFAVTDLHIDLTGSALTVKPGDREKARKLSESNEEVMACFPYFRARMDQLRAEYDRLAVRR